MNPTVQVAYIGGMAIIIVGILGVVVAMHKHPATPINASQHRPPQSTMPGNFVHRCRAAKITAEQAEQVTILQISTLAREKYDLNELPQIVRERVSSEVAQFWGSAFRG